MAWTPPRTWVANELVSAVLMNTHVRDNLLAISSIPAARVYHTSNQSVTTVTVTSLIFTSERFDTDTIHDPTDPGVPDRLTCKTAGIYDIRANVEYAANATGIRYTAIRLNATTNIAAVISANAGGGNPTIHNLSTLYSLAVNDYVQVTAYQESGGSLDVVATGNRSPEFMMQRVSI